MIRRTALILLRPLLASPAAAAKAPKSLCLSISTYAQLALVVKKVGTAKTAAGKTTFYEVAGEVSFPLVATSTLLAGSGRMAGDVLDFQVSGSNLREVDTTFSAAHFQGTWDVVQRTGAISNIYLYGDDGVAQAVTDIDIALTETGCETVQLFD